MSTADEPGTADTPPEAGAARCPSSRCQPGSVLLGLVGPDQKVRYLPRRLEVDRQFVQIARQGRAPEQRFRFSSRCVEGACAQWTGSRCGVVDRVMDELGVSPNAAPAADLPDCSIRPECRWWRQSGPAACVACPEVITEIPDREGENAQGA